MEDDWGTYLFDMGGKPASNFVNLAYGHVAPIDGLSTYASVRVMMRHARDDGLSGKDDYEELYAIEDALLTTMGQSEQSRFVGRTTYDGYRYFYFYVTDRDIFDRAVAQARAAFPGHLFEVSVSEDLQWKRYFDFLFPKERELQLIMNGKVLAALESQGDRHDITRRIDHLVKFSDRTSADAYATYVVGDGFAIIGSVSQKDDGRWWVNFDREDTPQDIDNISLRLFDKAVEMGGDYDGWGCVAKTGGDH